MIYIIYKVALLTESTTANNNTVNDMLVWISNLLNIHSLLVVIIIPFIMCLYALVTYKWRVNAESKKNINELVQNGKYIPGLFVELNDIKEMLRFFCNNNKWKYRIIKEYNTLFDDEYGKILSDMAEGKVLLKMSNHMTLQEIKKTIITTQNFLTLVCDRRGQLNDRYKNQQFLFDIHGQNYFNQLEKLLLKTEMQLNSYLVITGSAGNGKTNLLCSMAQTLDRSSNVCYFVNARNIKNNDLKSYIEKATGIRKEIFNAMLSLRGYVTKKNTIFIVDAVNENDDKDFLESILPFVKSIHSKKGIKVIFSCRSEYFDLKYKKYLCGDNTLQPYILDVKTEEYTYLAKEKLFENYRNHFNFNGQISNFAKEKLFSQLLLMRMFFEVYKNKSDTITSLNKYEIFQEYIKTITRNYERDGQKILNCIVQNMISSNNYDFVSLDVIDNLGVNSNILDQIMDESILLNKRVINNEGTIIEVRDEVIYFVFDEMRDYCIARSVLLDSQRLSREIRNDKVLSFVTTIKQKECNCMEGILSYFYTFFKANNDVEMLENLLSSFVYDVNEQLSFLQRNREEGINDFGINLILSDGSAIFPCELNYIKEVITSRSVIEASKLFFFLVKQEMSNSIPTLDIYIDILFSSETEEQFSNLLNHTIASYSHNDRIGLDNIIPVYEKLHENNIEGSERYLLIIISLLCLFTFEGSDNYIAYFKKRKLWDKSIISIKNKLQFRG